MQKHADKIIHHVSGRDVGSLHFTAKDIDANFIADLPMIGVGLDAALVPEMVRGLGFDSLQGLTTTASVTTPVQFLQTWLPGFVQVVTAARKIDMLVGVTTVGAWENEEIVQGVMELTGSATPYNDYSNVPLSSWNNNFERRTVVRFEEGLQVGMVEEARAAAIRVNAAERKRNAAALALEIIRNRVGFYGFNNGANRTYGFLNDPNLPAYVNLPNGAASSPLWSSKTFTEIVADIVSSFKTLRSQSKDVIDPKRAKTVLAIASDVVDYLQTMNSLGTQSVADWLASNYPNCRTESAPELNAANGGANVFYIYAESVEDGSDDGGMTFMQAVPTKFQALGVERKAKSYIEDYANATAGVMCKRPFGVVRRSGC